MLGKNQVFFFWKLVAYLRSKVVRDGFTVQVKENRSARFHLYISADGEYSTTLWPRTLVPEGVVFGFA